MKTYLQRREEELCDAIAQINDQCAWCLERGHKDLVTAYNAGESQLLFILSEVQDALQQLKNEEST